MPQHIRLLGGPFDGQTARSESASTVPDHLGFDRDGSGAICLKDTQDVLDFLSWHVIDPNISMEMELESSSSVWTATYRNTGRRADDGAAEFEYLESATDAEPSL